MWSAWGDQGQPRRREHGVAEEAQIIVDGARVHNLRDLHLALPRGQLIVFTGVSGSGKSSLAFGVLHAEGQRRLIEALSPRLRGKVEGLPRPDVDLITGLPPTIGISAHPGAGSARSTLATRTEIHDLLRALWSHEGVARCPECQRDLPVFSADLAAARLTALPEGSLLTVMAPVARGKKGSLSELFDEMAGLGFARARVDGEIVRLDERPALDARVAHDLDVVIDRIRVAPDRADRMLEAVQMAWSAGKGRMLALAQNRGSEQEDALFFADHPACPEGHVSLARPEPALFSFNTAEGACPRCEGTGRAEKKELSPPCAECGGSRLSAAARAFRVGGHSLPVLLGEPVARAHAWAETLQTASLSAPLRDELRRRLALLVALGLGHLTLGQGSDAFSAGEGRRVHLASQTSGDLSGVLYVIDEPTAGLGPEESAAVLGLVRRLVQAGNSAVVVSHDPLIIDGADRVVEIGPGAGAEGGRVLYEGGPRGLEASDTPTGRARSGQLEAPRPRARAAANALVLSGARGWNLAGVDLRLPLGCLVSVSGPSGAGKTALFDLTLGRALAARLHGAGSPPLPFSQLEGVERVRRLVRLSQAPLGRSRRSCTATVAGVWAPIRRLFAETREARVRGYGPETFSFNRPGGRCEACEGAGVRAVKLHLLPDIDAPCERCEGRRFGPGALSVRYRGLDVAQILALTVTEARRLFMAQPAIEPRLRTLESAGLGYLRLGQAADTLSGGEAERVRLARELGLPGDLPGTLYLLDAPSLGLHPQDICRLVELLQELVDQGASVVAVDNDPLIVRAADHPIRMGPGAGRAGGRLLAQL